MNLAMVLSFQLFFFGGCGEARSICADVISVLLGLE
jgi:hypothetical protein